MESFPPGQIRILTCLSSSTFICLLTAQWPLSTSPHRVLPTLRTSSPQKMTYKQSPCTLLGPLPHAPLFSLVPYSANSSNLKTLNSESLVHWNHHLMLNFISLFSGLVNIPLGKKKREFKANPKCLHSLKNQSPTLFANSWKQFSCTFYLIVHERNGTRHFTVASSRSLSALQSLPMKLKCYHYQHLNFTNDPISPTTLIVHMNNG